MRLCLARSMEMRILNLFRHVENKLLGVSLALGTRFHADVAEVVELGGSIAHDLVHGVVQNGKQLLIVSLFALGRQLIVQAPHAAAKDSPPAVDVVSGREPGR